MTELPIMLRQMYSLATLTDTSQVPTLVTANHFPSEGRTFNAFQLKKARTTQMTQTICKMRRSRLENLPSFDISADPPDVQPIIKAVARANAMKPKLVACIEFRARYSICGANAGLTIDPISTTSALKRPMMHTTNTTTLSLRKS